MSEPLRVEETHECLLRVDQTDSFELASFKAFDFSWQICGDIASEELGLWVLVEPEALQSKRNIAFSLNLVNHADPSKSVTAGTRDTLCSGSATAMFFETLANLNDTACGYQNDKRELCIRANSSAQDVSCALQPPQSVDGDLSLQLDDGCTLTAHATLLQLASTVFAGVLACSSQQASAGDPEVGEASPASKRHRPMLKLPLPGTSRQQALLLLHCLYAGDPRSWTKLLDLPQLADLGRIAHRFGCTAVLRLVDSRLVKLVSCRREREGNKSMADAPANFAMARESGLTKFEAYLGYYMGANPGWVDLQALDSEPGLVSVLRGARAGQDSAAATARAWQKRT